MTGTRGPMHRRLAPASRTRGFTLVEVILATVLLAAGLALAFATITASTRTVSRSEQLAAKHERMRSVESFLRRRIAGTRPVSFGIDDATNLPQRFIGEPGRMRFVADLPDYLGRGGPYLHDFVVEDGRILLTLSMVLGGELVEERETVDPEPLVEGLREATFRYRALDGQGGLGDWMDEWTAVEQLPLLVEVTMVDADGTRWPPMVVGLQLAGTATGTGITQ